jgi:hypothetical protein
VLGDYTSHSTIHDVCMNSMMHHYSNSLSNPIPMNLLWKMIIPYGISIIPQECKHLVYQPDSWSTFRSTIYLIVDSLYKYVILH